MNSIKIRKAGIEDIKDVVPVRSCAWKYAYDGIIDDDFLDKWTNPENYSDVIKKWEKRFGNKGNEIFLVAELDKKIIGFASGGTPKSSTEVDSEIVALYVDPNYHQLGVGKKLFTAFADIVRKDGAKTIVIGCLRDNKSVGFYKKIGGRILKEGFWEYENGKLPELFFVFYI